MPAAIHRDRIEGTRITIYDIMDYVEMKWHHSSIALWLNLSSEQVLAAMKYIEEHKEEVEVEYRKILEREARGNPPELQAKIDETHRKYAPMWEERRKRFAEENHEGNSSR